MSFSSNEVLFQGHGHGNGMDDRAGIFFCDSDVDMVIPNIEAERLEVNSDTAFEFENDLFVGRIVILHRPPTDSADPSPYRDFFASKKRRWELRWQGQFKQPLTSGVEFGVDILQAHSPRLNFASRTFFSLLVKFAQSLARNRGSDVYTNSTEEDCVTKYFRFPIHNCDMILSTPEGCVPPNIAVASVLVPNGLHTHCNSAFKSDISSIPITPTYTFVFYSMYLDFCSWDVHNVPLGLNGMSINRIVGNQPLNVIMRPSLGTVPFFRLVVGNRNTSPAWQRFLALDSPSEEMYFSAGGGANSFPSFSTPPPRHWTFWGVTKRMLGLPSRYLGACLRAPVSFVMRSGKAPKRNPRNVVVRHIPTPDTQTRFYSTRSV